MVERILIGPGGATEDKQDEILSNLRGERALRLDYTGGPTPTDPVYIGTAPIDADESDAEWVVKKLTYVSGNIVSIQTRTNTEWTDRTTPTPAWD